MKPIKLVMSAFGSYAEQEIIDFEKVNQGIFLITGDTGTGKTTVFDAITYALYDQTSGGKREGDMMRSQYANPDTPTFVEFTFLYHGKLYIVHRNPNYKRMRKRKNKDGTNTLTTEAASVTLIMPNGQEFIGKIREVNEKIVEILGVGAPQFTQIAMIAQGEFIKLLHASSKERKEIFSRIFDTRIYANLQMCLREQSKLLYGKLEDNRRLCIHEIQGVQYLPESRYIKEWEESRNFLETNPEQIQQNLKRFIIEIEEKETVMQKRETENQKCLEENVCLIHQAKEINQLFIQEKEEEKSIAFRTKLLQQQREEEQKSIREFQGWKFRYKEQMPKLLEQLASWRGFLPKYVLLKEKQEVLLSAEKEQVIVEKFAEQAKQNLQEVQKAIDDTENKKKTFEKTTIEIPILREAKKELSKREILLEEMNETGKRLESYEKMREQEKKNVQQALLFFQEKSREYEEKNQKFIEEQIGVIAQSLQEGKACPVCGSLEHPKKAKLSSSAVTQQQVEQAKKNREQADQKLNLCREEFQKIQESCEKEKSLLEQDGRRIFTNGFDISMILTALEECKEKKRQAEIQLEEAKKRERLLQQQKDKLEQLKRELGKFQRQQEEALQKQYETKLLVETAKQGMRALLEELPFETEQELQQHIQKAETEKIKLETEKEQAEEGLQELQQKIAENQGILIEQQKNYKKLEQRLEGKEQVELTVFLEHERKLKKEAKVLEKEKIQLTVLKSRNQQTKQQLSKLYQEREQLRKQYEIVSNLDKTANGNLTQHIRIDFQTYVQRHYFKYMIAEANKHLSKMNGNQFLLQCRDLEHLGKQGEAGLDLDIYDLVTDKVRDVKTLSGGESFLAALSMALGMSEVIQNTAGRVHLDTMFIDEGFGSLDEEARDRAISILNELAGESRLVGIISHVTELKEQIDRKLVISKNKKGSHAKWVLES